MSDEYNGWTNRETWAFNLHWHNDQGLYFETLDVARSWAAQSESDYQLGESVVSYWQERIAEEGEAAGRGMAPPFSTRLAALFMMRDEVGSWWRIDCTEIGASVRESLENEL